MENQNCKCGRRAKYTFSTRGGSQAPEDQAYACGYHVWWHGCPIDEEERAYYCDSHRITQ